SQTRSRRRRRGWPRSPVCGRGRGPPTARSPRSRCRPGRPARQSPPAAPRARTGPGTPARRPATPGSPPPAGGRRAGRSRGRPARRSDCAVACTLDIIGDRWTLLIVRDLLRGKRYFDEFLRAPEGIATNVLSARLRALCAQGWVEKTPDPSDQRRYTYRLSG